MRNLMEKLRVKYGQATHEIKDLENEHQFEKQTLVNTIRSSSKELLMMKAIVKMLLSDEELATIRSKTKWIDERNMFKIPPFVLKGDRVELPKLPYKQGKRPPCNKRLEHVLIAFSYGYC